MALKWSNAEGVDSPDIAPGSVKGGLGVMIIMLCGALIVGEHMSLGGALAGNTGTLSTATSRRRSLISGGSVS